MAQWKHEYTEPPIDLRAYAKPETDWRVQLDMAILSFAVGAKDIAAALSDTKHPERAAYVRSNARHFGEPLPLKLVCSVWLALAELEAAE